MTLEAKPELEIRPISLRALVLEFLKIGAAGFGGGMAIIALMEQQLVTKRRVMEGEEFAHGVALGQILGPFSFNTALFTGYRLYGTLGGLLTAHAFMVPSLVLVLILSWLYFAYHAIPALQGAVAGLSPVVIALILSAGWSIGRKALRSWIAMLVCAAAAAAALYKVNPVYVLVAAGLVGLKLGTRMGGPNHSFHRAAEADSDRLKPSSRLGVSFWPFSLSALAGGVSLIKLGLTFLGMGFMFFGGAFVLVPVMHQMLVLKLGWLSPQEFIDGVAISSLTPGPISVLATFAGYRLRGVPGALLATGALYFPAIVVMLTLCREYEHLKGRQETQAFLAGVTPAVVGLIVSTGILLAYGTLHSWRACVLAALAVLLLLRWRLPPAFLLAMGALAGAAGILP